MHMESELSPQDIVRSGLCIGCGSCVAQSSHNAQMQFDIFGQLQPQGTSEWFQRGSALFSRICPFSPSAANEDQLAAALFPSAKQSSESLGRFETAYVGHVAEEDFRSYGSSGGMVTWVATELLRKNMIDGVAHVVATEDPQAEGRFFKYRLSRTEAEIRAGAKSRYYPTDLTQILRDIRAIPGRYAVIGIPCFIKAVQLLRREDALFQERIRYTLGLFCGHMKSARFIESFAWQMNVPISEVQKVEFRHKDPSRSAKVYTARLTLRNGNVISKDWWHLADGDWGAGFFMNSACNYCDDVVAETSDISFGDAWVEPYSSDGRGTNVVITRLPFFKELLETAIDQARLKLDLVDAKFVEQTQAAGFRQRREGLAYRLTWHRRGLQPRKRVAPDSQTPTKLRKLIYRMRYHISSCSHWVFRCARWAKRPRLYIYWARMVAAVYHGLAYHRGKFREMMKRLRELVRS
jgi:coenzyme F420-reducing hydrogenase beta subunit